MKKISKSIKIDYLLNSAVSTYAEKNKLSQIEVIEKALTQFFQEKKEHEGFEVLGQGIAKILEKLEQFDSQ